MIMLPNAFFLLGLMPLAVEASTLVRRGRLETVSTDTSDLEFGGDLVSNDAGSGCSWNTFYDDCSDISGTKVYSGHGNKPPFYILQNDGDLVTFCGRWRRESVCHLCNNLGCTSTTSEDYGGRTTTRRLVPSTTEIASLSLSEDLDNACSGVCTDDSNLVFPLQPRSQCEVAQGWAAVNDDYDRKCPVEQACQELEVHRGCEDSQTSSFAGIYKPLVDTSRCSDYVDKTRTVYVKNGDETYLYHRAGQDEWVFDHGGCSKWGVSKGFFDAGDEPYLATEDEISCYNGGFTSNKRYISEPLEMSCKKMSGGESSSAGTFSGPSFMGLAVLLCFAVFAGSLI